MATTTSVKTIAHEYGLKGSSRELFATACMLHLTLWIAERFGRAETETAKITRARLRNLRTHMKKNVRSALDHFVKTHPIGVKIQLVQLVDEERYFDRRNLEEPELDPDHEAASEDGAEGAVSLRDIGDLSWDPNSY